MEEEGEEEEEGKEGLGLQKAGCNNELHFTLGEEAGEEEEAFGLVEGARESMIGGEEEEEEEEAGKGATDTKGCWIHDAERLDGPSATGEEEAEDERLLGRFRE